MEEKKNIMDYDTVSLDDENSAVVIIDQTKLPGTTEIIALKTAQEIWDAIYLLQVRGAPAIGVAAAYGIYVLAKGIDTDNYDAFYAEFKKQKEYLDSSRPTAVNLSWALNRMEQVCLGFGKPAPDGIVPLLDKPLLRVSDKAATLRLRDGVQLSDGTLHNLPCLPVTDNGHDFF